MNLCPLWVFCLSLILAWCPLEASWGKVSLPNLDQTWQQKNSYLEASVLYHVDAGGNFWRLALGGNVSLNIIANNLPPDENILQMVVAHNQILWTSANQLNRYANGQSQTWNLMRPQLLLDNDEQLVIAAWENSEWRMGPWSDNLQTWQNSADGLSISMTSDTQFLGSHAHSISSNTMGVLHQQYRSDELGSWQERIPDSQYITVYALRQGGVELQLCEQGSRLWVLTSGDGARTWNETEVPNWEGSFFAADWNADGTLDIVDDRQHHYSCDSSDIYMWTGLWAQAKTDGLSIYWAKHPWASGYRLKLGGNLVAEYSADMLSYEFQVRPEWGSVIDFEFKINAQWLTGQSLTLEQGSSVQWSHFFSSAQSVADYQMISVPGNSKVWDGPNAFTPLRFLEAYLGAEYHPSNWILGWWSPEIGDYVSGPDVGELLPGKSYWMISAWNFRYDIIGFEPQQDEMVLNCEPGWNMLATPYSRTVDVAELSVMEAGQRWAYDDILNTEQPPIRPGMWTWIQGAYVQTDKLVPSAGVWMQNLRSENVYVVVPRLKMAKPQRGKARYAGEDALPPSPPVQGLAKVSAGGAGGGGCMLR
jgi:hypothetical protein